MIFAHLYLFITICCSAIIERTEVELHINILILIYWYHPAILISMHLFWPWVELSPVQTRLSSSVLQQPSGMGKSLLHRVSPCQKYLWAAIIWHREKVEGDSGCKMASCGCRLKHAPTYLHRTEASPVFLKENLLSGTRLRGSCYSIISLYV